MNSMKLAKKLLMPLLCIVLSVCHSPAGASQVAPSMALAMLKKLKLSDIPKLLSLIQKNPRLAIGRAVFAYSVYRIWKYTKGQPSAFMEERRIHDSAGDTFCYFALGILGYKYLFNPKLLHVFGASDDDEPDNIWLIEIILHGAALAKLFDLQNIWRRNTHDATIRALEGNNARQAVDYQQGFLGNLIAPDPHEVLSQAIQAGNTQVVHQCLLPSPNSMIMMDHLRKPEGRIQRFATAVDQARKKLNEDPGNVNRKVILDMLTNKQEEAAKAIGHYLSRQPAVHRNFQKLSKEHAAHREQLKENLSVACDQPLTKNGETQLPASVARHIGRLLTGSSVVEAREKTAQHKPIIADHGDAKSN